MDEQEEKNKSSIFEKQSLGEAKSKLDDLNRKNKKSKKVITTIIKYKSIFIPLLIVLGIIIFILLWAGFVNIQFGGSISSTNKAKKAAITTSYSYDLTSPGTGNNEDNDIDIEKTNRIVVRPTKNRDSYEITNNYTKEEIKEIRDELQKDTSRDISDFTDFEIAIIGALDESGLNIDDWTISELKCFPTFIKAEACTQYLDLRENGKKFKNGQYIPEKISSESNKVPGVILVQRTNTNGNETSTLEYMQESEFNKLVKENDQKARDYFTLNDKGNLVIAKWEMEEIKVKGDYPENLPESEKEQGTNGKKYIITTEEINYSEYIKKYTMPFELLVQLLSMLEDPDFCLELANYVMESKIVINIQEEETVTHTIEEREYTINKKDKKIIDYRISPTVEIESGKDYLLKNGKENIYDKNNECTNYEKNITKVRIDKYYTSHSYMFEVTEADTWIAHYIKSYNDPEQKKEPEYKDKITDIPDDYKKINEQTITNPNEIIKDENVKTFKEEKENYYKSLITIPKVNLKTGTKYINDPLTNQFIEIPGNDEITITPKNKIESTSLPNGETEYECEHDKLPTKIDVTTISKKELPSISFTYYLNNGKYKTSYTKEQIAECNITKLEIKEYERIDTVNNITENITRWESDSNPKNEVYIYEKKNEKFLKAYDNSERAQHMMKSISSWLFESMEEDGRTFDFVDMIKYLLYKYDGTDYGVTELTLDGLYETNMSNFYSGIYGNSIQEKVWFALKSLGYSDVSIAAAMGNIHYESGSFDPNKVESGYDEYNGGIGICQWTNSNRGNKGRNTNLKKYAQSKGKTWQDEDIQVEFLIGELTKGGGADGYASFALMNTSYTGKTYKYSDWVNATDDEKLDKDKLNKLTEIFCFTFERPSTKAGNSSMSARQKYALEYYNKFHGKERAGGDFKGGSKDIIGTFTSGITGRTFTIFNQTMSGLGSSRGRQWTGYCNKCVAACIATGYNNSNIDDALNRSTKWGNILSNEIATKNYFSVYGLEMKSSTYSKENIRSELMAGKYIAVYFNKETRGKSGKKYCNQIHWIGIIGYKNENGKEQIFISDSGFGATGWISIDEFENCKRNIKYFQVISEKR